jgi:hypothetical protein
MALHASDDVSELQETILHLVASAENQSIHENELVCQLPCTRIAMVQACEKLEQQHKLFHDGVFYSLTP